MTLTVKIWVTSDDAVYQERPGIWRGGEKSPKGSREVMFLS